MGYANLLYEVEDRVATLTLNRPERNNAFDEATALELRAAWEQIKADPEVVCVIVTGAGDRAFCTGMDLSAVASGGTKRSTSMGDSPFAHMTAIHNQCWKPVITAVNGMAVGGGLHFIADSDLIVASEHATFFDTHVKVGLVAGLEPVGLARRIPLEAVLRMSLLGGSERMTASQAQEVGLVGEVVAHDALMHRARELAGKIALHSPAALARTKRAIWQSLDGGLNRGLENAWSIIAEHSGSPDPKEGATAFMEKRAPRWEGYTD